MDWAASVFVALSIAGCVYAIAAAVAVRRFARAPAKRNDANTAVTILKPLHGAEPELYANLRSFCEQDYPAQVQIVFGAPDPGDAAGSVALQLIGEFTDLDVELVAGSGTGGANRKMSKLAAMQPSIRNPIVVISDSDIRVPRDYLRTVVTTLAEPGVGLVTCLYRGEPERNLWSRLAAMAIDYQFVPSVAAGVALRRAQPSFGATIALTRHTLERIGGFERFVDYLADDYAMGEAVRKLGLRVAIAPALVVHRCSERTLGELLQHELRWARTIRGIDPLGYAGSLVTHFVPLAVIATVLRGFDPVGVAILAGAVVCRVVVAMQVDHTLGSDTGRWWLLPLRDVLSFIVFAASFFIGVVTWRGRRYVVRRDGTIIEAKESKA